MIAMTPFKKKKNKLVIIFRCQVNDKTWRRIPGSGVNLSVWIQAKILGKYPYWAPTIQFRANPNKAPLVLPNALREMRIGNARTAGPNTTSPHV